MQQVDRSIWRAQNWVSTLGPVLIHIIIPWYTIYVIFFEPNLVLDFGFMGWYVKSKLVLLSHYTG